MTNNFAKKITFEQMYSFLKEHYLHSRFGGRDGVYPSQDGKKYSEIVTQGALEYLQEHGKGSIGIYESRSGAVVIYDEDLRVLNPDEPPAQIEAQPANSWYRASC